MDCGKSFAGVQRPAGRLPSPDVPAATHRTAPAPAAPGRRDGRTARAPTRSLRALPFRWPDPGRGGRPHADLPAHGGQAPVARGCLLPSAGTLCVAGTDAGTASVPRGRRGVGACH
ncbi:hypothetical protein G6F50_016168 [Rhizopus delemar]|uniref:Uncharacterized protein n=1 Tax=Rhizopus delemar TaxID=936053 RepID=A0A9P6XU33_9FUNG|nr:hypothetical protein G6F50_016168 [Rhizopus delemar]